MSVCKCQKSTCTIWLVVVPFWLASCKTSRLGPCHCHETIIPWRTPENEICLQKHQQTTTIILLTLLDSGRIWGWHPCQVSKHRRHVHAWRNYHSSIVLATLIKLILKVKIFPIFQKFRNILQGKFRAGDDLFTNKNSIQIFYVLLFISSNHFSVPYS